MDFTKRVRGILTSTFGSMANPMGVMGSLMLVSFALSLTYKYGIGPVIRRKSYERNQEFAEFVFDENKENMIKNS